MTRFNTQTFRKEKMIDMMQPYYRDGYNELYMQEATDKDEVRLYDFPKVADGWMKNRMEKFLKTKESVLNQDGDFEWIISIDKRTPTRFMNKIFTDERMIGMDCDIRDSFNGLELDVDWVITSRLDNDDQYLPWAIKAIQSKFEPTLKVIDIGYNEYEWETGKVYDGVRRWPNSMFLSLVEPAERIKTVYCRPHGQVHSGYPMGGDYKTEWTNLKAIKAEKIHDKYAYMVCHDNNVTNRVRGEEIK